MGLKNVKAKLRESFDKKRDEVSLYLDRCEVSRDLSGENYLVCPGDDSGEVFEYLAEHDNVSIIAVDKNDGSFSCFVCSNSAADKAFEAACRPVKAPAQTQETGAQATLEGG